MKNGISMKSSRKFGCFVVVLLVVIISAVLIANYISTRNKVNEAGVYVLKALKSKYNKDFVIDSGHYISNTGGYEFKVYPKNDTDFTFNAWLNGMTESGESDMYLIMSQANEGKKMVAPFIEAISKDYYISSIGINVAGTMKESEPLLIDMHSNNLTADDMLKKYPDKMEISFTCHINYNINNTNEDSVLKKVYKLIEFLKEKKFGAIQISLSLYDFPGKSIKKLGEKEGVNFSGDYLKKAKYFLTINPNNIDKIYNFKDLRELLKDASKIKWLYN